MGSEQARRAAAPLPRRLARRTRIRLQGRHGFRGRAAADDPVVSRGAPGGRQVRRCVGLGLGDSTAVCLTWLSFRRSVLRPAARIRLMTDAPCREEARANAAPLFDSANMRPSAKGWCCVMVRVAVKFE